MTTNKEFLDELASHGDGSLQAWFDAEHDQYPKGHESLNGYEERLYDVKVSECPYCGRDRVVIHDFNDGYEEPDSYRVEHLDEREACTAGCYEMYFAFSSVEDAVKHADMRGGYKNEHPKNMYVSAEDFEFLQEQLSDDAHSKDAPVLTDVCTESESGFTDSREKLEADIYRAADEMEKFTHGEQFINVNKILRWLDRQAAITAQEYRDNFTGFGLLHDLNESGISVKYLPEERRFVFDDHALVGYQAQVDSLQAELDEVTTEWSNVIDGWHKAEKRCDELQAEYDELDKRYSEIWSDCNEAGLENERLRAELDKWHKLTDGIVLPDYPMTQYQPNSRADLEAEVHYWLTSHVAVSVNVGEIEAEVRKWLDMQMAICGEQFKSYYARKMALHGCGAADDRINELEVECLYWKGQVLKSLECATKIYAEGVMAYPRPDGYTEPSLLVNDEINSLRDFHADDQRLIAKLEAELAESRRDTESYRKKLSHAVDNAHDTCMLMDEGMA